MVDEQCCRSGLPGDAGTAAAPAAAEGAAAAAAACRGDCIGRVVTAAIVVDGGRETSVVPACDIGLPDTTVRRVRPRPPLSNGLMSLVAGVNGVGGDVGDEAAVTMVAVDGGGSVPSVYSIWNENKNN